VRTLTPSCSATPATRGSLGNRRGGPSRRCHPARIVIASAASVLRSIEDGDDRLLRERCASANIAMYAEIDAMSVKRCNAAFDTSSGVNGSVAPRWRRRRGRGRLRARRDRCGRAALLVGPRRRARHGCEASRRSRTSPVRDRSRARSSRASSGRRSPARRDRACRPLRVRSARLTIAWTRPRFSSTNR